MSEAVHGLMSEVGGPIHRKSAEGEPTSEETRAIAESLAIERVIDEVRALGEKAAGWLERISVAEKTIEDWIEMELSKPGDARDDARLASLYEKLGEVRRLGREVSDIWHDAGEQLDDLRERWVRLEGP